MRSLISALIHLIDAMFVAGVLGSTIVVLLTSVEDFNMLFAKGPSAHPAGNQEGG